MSTCKIKREEVVYNMRERKATKIIKTVKREQVSYFYSLNN